MKNVNDLPPEIINEILSFVSTETLIHVTSFLSHNWFELSANDKLLELRCESDNLSKFCSNNVHKQIKVHKKHNQDVEKPISSHLKRQYYHLKKLQSEMRLFTEFRKVVSISEDGRNAIVKVPEGDAVIILPGLNSMLQIPQVNIVVSCPTPLNTELDISYFEVIFKRASDYQVAIGLFTKMHILKFIEPIGLELGSIAYYGDDGKVYCGTRTDGMEEFDKFGKGDTVGCGVFDEHIFFTKNGKFQGYAALQKMLQTLFPCISTGGSCEFDINFGQHEFMYDLEKIEKPCDFYEMLYDSEDEEYLMECEGEIDDDFDDEEDVSMGYEQDISEEDVEINEE